VLASFSRAAQRNAAAELRRRGVDLRLGAKVAEVTAEEVVLVTGERIPSRTVVWAAGVRANPLADGLGVEQTSAGRVLVGADLSLPGRPRAFAAGDIAGIPAPDGQLLPQLAPVAKQSGAFVGRRIARLVAGDGAGTFRYHDRGTMATIGRNAAVADLPFRIHLSGRPAWLAWLLLHLVFLVGFRNRVSVLVDWTWNYLTYERGPRVIVGRQQVAAVAAGKDRAAVEGRSGE
jgi:NADH dehydrogenase